MAPKLKRTDYYSANAIAKDMPYNNPFFKVNWALKGVNQFKDDEEIDQTIAALEARHKETVKLLKSLRSNK